MPLPTWFRRFALATLAALAALPLPLGAQGTLPFRAGQWGAQFIAGEDFSSLGVIRFTAPNRALVFDARLQISTVDADIEEIGGPNTATFESSETAIALLGGYRWYRPVTSQVAAFWTLGAMVERASQSQEVEQPGFPSSREEFSILAAGPFGQLGAVYLPTRHFSIGAIAHAHALFGTLEQEDDIARAEGSVTDIAAEMLSLVATIYF